MLSATSLAVLRELVGEVHVVTDPDVMAGAVTDWTGRFRGSSPALVRPGSVEEVAAVVAHCRNAGIALVPQGGNTGLVGGSVPLHGEMVLSLARLDRIEPIDPLSRQVTVGAGATVAALQAAAARHGLSYAVDFAARDTATIGGTIATNAGGVHVMRWGATRAQLVGIEAVRADGRILRHLGGLEKDNTGYDLTGLLCGSEGTLAVITAARLRLVPTEPEIAVAVLGFGSVSNAVAAVAGLRAAVPGLSAAELMLADGVDLVCEQLGRNRPLRDRWPAVVLVEVRGRDDPTPSLIEALDGSDGPTESAVATTTDGRAALWALREDHTLAINQLGAPHKLDVTLRLGDLAAFVEDVPSVVAELRPEAQVWQFGHLGDGNIHVNITGLAPDDDEVDAAVLTLVAGRGGSISAEHGIGAAKRPWLHLCRSGAEIDTFRDLKAALDPTGILNPHVLLPDLS
jgi:FAD/FMN-containing dehydrogenase